MTLVIWAGLMAWAGSILAAGGWTPLDGVLLVCFAFGTPWAVLGLCNAALGLWLLHGPNAVSPNAAKEGAPDALDAVAPFLVSARYQAPLMVDTAILMTLRNEDPARALLRLKTVKASLDATGEGRRFSYFLLSDTDDLEVARQEENAVAAWRRDDANVGLRRDDANVGLRRDDANVGLRRDDANAGLRSQDFNAARITYRRRTDNTGFKAGNVRDFCETHGRDFELMVPLDADSLMTGAAIVDLVRIMQAHPRLGILQSLVVGMPSGSPFARLFQFGMRFGMRSYTVGQAWWVGDCGPFWGHNAAVRIEPLLEHCRLPILPGKPPLGGHVLSHDQVEAALMRRAGFEVRVMPVENGSYEENPPDVLEFIRRDVRWCQGNMQYLKLLGLPGLKPVSRFQLVWAILMFIGIPAWTMMIALSPLAAREAQGIADFPVASLKTLYVTFLAMSLAPKIAGLVDALLTQGEVMRFGGRMRFFASAALELVFSFLQGAVSTIRTSIFMAGLLFGKSILWGAQRRDARGLTWEMAAQALWPQTLFGIAVLGLLWHVSPATLVWSLPLTAGYVLAIPFAVMTSGPALGAFMRRHGIAGIPEDFAPPAEIIAVQGAGARPS
ncbi:MAG: glucans biosynthesis glucosyltransferase MdoH [Hyphomicrobium sp.]